MAARRGKQPVMSDPPSPPLSAPLLIADSAVLSLVALQVSAFKALSIAISDLTAPGFDLVEDIADFDLAATTKFIGIEQFGAAALVLGWLVGGGLLSDACRVDWTQRDEDVRWRTLIQGYAAAVPSALLIKYGALTQVELPSLGRTEQAIELEASLAGLTVSNVLGDAVGMLVALVLWRALLLRNPNLFL